MTRSVLLVDDDADLRALLRSALGAVGLAVLEAATISAAQDHLAHRSPDVIVVDGQLPDGQGVELIERIRTRDRVVRIVFVSAFYRDLTTFKRLTTELDVAMVVYKPIDPASFAAKVSELAGPAALAAGSPRPAEPGSATAFAIELAELRTQFSERLPAKLDELAQAAEAARRDIADVAAARMLAHRLRGSAGSYGHTAVGEAVGVVEDRLAEAAATVGSVRRHLWEELEQALHDARAATAATSTQSQHRIDPSPPPVKALLVVDDDQDFLQMVRATARKLHVSVVTASSPDEALQRGRGQPLIAAILDIHLGEQASFTLARQLRQLPGNGELPIAFASVDNRIETRMAAMEAGASRYFEKPLMEDGFVELVLGFVRESEARQTRVLVVDDDREMVESCALHLRRAGMAVESMESADELIEQLEATQPDILLLDVALPRISGIDVCRALRMSERWGRIPILILTAHTDTTTRIRAFRAGASDVISKPVVAEELLARLGVQEERLRLFRDRVDKDALSGLLLRRPFVEAFQRAVSSCDRTEQPLALALLDLDHFKRINDTYGHLVGDQVIARLGELLRARFRTEDLRARWGGEEFVLVFVGATKEFAEMAMRRLLTEFRELRFTAEDGTLFGATFTAAVSAFPTNGRSLAALIRSADEQLYAGKRAGRNRISTSPGTHPAREKTS